ncbi:MAG: transcriptional repressor [candidate division WOR-3 bacterium]|nr:MAG: transcriptional repressor [candidate division WOR-3 bacterium]
MIKMTSNSEHLKELLAEKGLKPTYQRLMILDYLQEHRKEHLTVEKIYTALSGEMPLLSMTTVYNALSSFLKAGLVSAITITGTEVRYDFLTEPHHHFLCRMCGRISDVDVQCPVAERKSMKGYLIEEVHGYFKGLCKECLKRQRKQQA